MEILFLILAIVFFVLWTKEKKSSKEKSDQMEDSLSKANKRLEELSKYQQILDVETCVLPQNLMLMRCGRRLGPPEMPPSR